MLHIFCETTWIEAEHLRFDRILILFYFKPIMMVQKCTIIRTLVQIFLDQIVRKGKNDRRYEIQVVMMQSGRKVELDVWHSKKNKIKTTEQSAVAIYL